jgi:preprotein translocase subunit SecD
MDYVFFQSLTEKIDKASGEEKARLESIREKVLGFVADVDKQIEARMKQAQDFVESILEKDDVAKATQENLDGFTQDTVDLVNQMLKQASEKNDYARMGKLQKMMQVLQEASAPPPEVAFIEQLMQAPDDAAVEQMLKQNDAMVNQPFLDSLSGLVAQMESQGGGNPEAKAMGEKLGEVYKVALKYSMKKNMG